ncbi:hypothetical protein T01_1447 [Trichinella spiralis]|uniref:Uncharacterized protein n=1 Tax=Trichinella spiralis TaxID=6334 RepID=A0A0V1BNM2_TRISP|nr:hypothetical protein T01_1447 [Trichinella spiralis]
MKGATPNELVKGVTANQMSIIGIETEPELGPTGNRIYLLSFLVLLRAVRDLFRAVRDPFRVVRDLLN